MRKPADAPTAAADTRPPVVSSSAPAAPAATPSGDPGPAGTRAANLTTNPALDTRTTRTGEQSTKRSRKAAATAEPAAGADGLEPPPRVVLPAAPSVRGISDAAALPTVDAEAPDLVDKKKALERTVREIDSSMRRESGESGDLTR
jgi:hypothetical protein